MVSYAPLAALVALLAVSATAIRLPLQDNAGACSNAVPGSIQVPPEAVLYLSLTATGDVSYTCGPDGKPDLGNVREEAALANANKEFNPEGWSGKAFFNPDGNLQFDLAALEPAAATTVVLAKDIATAPSTFSPVPEARWSVLSTDGDVLPTAPAGLPQIAFVTRTTVDEGKIAKCPAGTTVKAPFTAAYNFYTCAGDYIGGTAPAPLGAPTPTAAPLPAIVAPPAPVLVPVPAISVLPPKVAPAPAPAPVALPIVLPVAFAPAPAPSSGAAGARAALAAAAAAAAALVLAA